MTDVTGTLDAWVEEDGTPVSMTITSTWKAVGKKTVDASRTATLTFGEPLADALIVAPTETWKFWNSKRYRTGWPTFVGGQGRQGPLRGQLLRRRGVRLRVSGQAASRCRHQRRILTQLKSITGYKKLKVTANSRRRAGRPARPTDRVRGTSNGETIYGGDLRGQGRVLVLHRLRQLSKWNDELRDQFSSMIGTFDYR